MKNNQELLDSLELLIQEAENIIKSADVSEEDISHLDHKLSNLLSPPKKYFARLS